MGTPLPEVGLDASLPKEPGPVSVSFMIPFEIQLLVVTLRLLLGWN